MSPTSKASSFLVISFIKYMAPPIKNKMAAISWINVDLYAGSLKFFSIEPKSSVKRSKKYK